MCVETCVQISEKSDEKWRSYSIRNLSSFVTRGVYKSARRSTCREGWGWGYWSKLLIFFYWKTLNVLFLASMSCVTSRKIALSPASELALPNDNSKHDCAGGKFKLLPGYLTDRDVWWLISKRKIHAIP